MKQPQEVSEQGGFRWFLVATLVAVFIGTLLRVTLAPSKIEKFVRLKIESSMIRENLFFANASVSLADGALPDLALVLTKVEWRKGGQCSDQRPIRAREVRVPVRFSSLLVGKIAAGSVKIDDLTIDLDDIKRDCGPSGGRAVPTTSAPATGPIVPAVNGAIATDGGAVLPGEVWSTEAQARISELLTGVRISRAEVFFENRMKSVVIEGASAFWRGDALDVSTSLKFPPSTVFGENLPTFTINGTVKRTEMIAEIRADLNEGALEANAVMKPIIVAGGSKQLDSDLKLSFSDLPLSVVTPLLSKSGIVTGAFQPKFMWLDCSAEIHGVFSRLFVDHPVTLSQCAVSGQIGRLSLEKAIRQANGEWQPFEVLLDKIDLARMLETFEVQGPEGVFTNFGQLTGKLSYKSPEAADVTANLSGAVIRFAGAEGVALQPFSVGKIIAKLSNRRWKLGLADFKPDGGEADLLINADADSEGRDGEIDVVLKHLKLNPRVEKVIFTGPVADISGSAKVAMAFSKSTGKANLTKLKASLQLREMRGSEIQSDEMKVEANLASGKSSPEEIELGAKSPDVGVLKTGNLFRLLQPSLLGWSGGAAEPSGLLRLSKVAVKGRFRGTGFQWSQASASVGQFLNLSSHGSVFRDHAVDAEIQAHFPLASRLTWNVAGTWMKPKFSGASPELSALFAKAGLSKDSVSGVIPARLLGLPKESEVPESSP